MALGRPFLQGEPLCGRALRPAGPKSRQAPPTQEHVGSGDAATYLTRETRDGIAELLALALAYPKQYTVR